MEENTLKNLILLAIGFISVVGILAISIWGFPKGIISL